MTTATPLSTEAVKQIVQKMDGLVDEHWRRGSLTQFGGKTCLLGLVGFALYGTNWIPDYPQFDPDSSYPDPEAIAVVNHIAEHCGPEPLLDENANSYERVYRQNDRHLKTADQVHEFLRGIL